MIPVGQQKSLSKVMFLTSVVGLSSALFIGRALKLKLISWFIMYDIIRF